MSLTGPVGPEVVLPMEIRFLFINIIILLLIILIGCGGKNKTMADTRTEITWFDSESALPKFPFGAKPFYMYFAEFDCSACSEMKEEIFTRPEIIEYLNNNFTCIMVVPDSIDTVTFWGEQLYGYDLEELFKLQGYPSHFFFNDRGELKGAKKGKMGLREFKLLLKYVSEGYVEKYDFSTYLKTPEAVIDTVRGKF